jgi:hypothetical protein
LDKPNGGIIKEILLARKVLNVDERIRSATQFRELGVTRKGNDDEKKKANIIT